jgi:hypothetical protein
LPGQAPGGIAATHATGLEGGWPRFPRQFRSRTLELVVPKVAARSSGAEAGCHPRSTPRFKYFSIRSGTGFVHLLPPFHISLVGRSRGMMHRCGEQNTHIKVGDFPCCVSRCSSNPASQLQVRTRHCGFIRSRSRKQNSRGGLHTFPPPPPPPSQPHPSSPAAHPCEVGAGQHGDVRSRNAGAAAPYRKAHPA